MSDKKWDNKVGKLGEDAMKAKALEKTKKKETKEMKKLTINPQLTGAFKLIAVAILIALGFYLGVNYQSHFDQSVTTEVARRVSQLKISQ